MRIKLLTFFMLLFLLCNVLVFSSPNLAFAESSAYTSAKSMIVIETKNNTILYSKNKDEKLPMASTTKIVTALTVINNCPNLNEIVKIPKQATLVEGSSIYLMEGEELSVKELLYGLMLQSGNDAATALALHVGKSIEGFSELMNQTAAKCGVKNSSFKNPHGLDVEGHYTTANDLAIITSFALKNKDFKEIVSCKKFVTNGSENTRQRTLVNKNKLLNSLQGCEGVKTGYTSRAGRCLVTACLRDDIELVCVVLNCGPMFEESASLINQAYNSFEYYEVLPDYNYVGEITVNEGVVGKVKIYSKRGLKLFIDKVKKDSLRIEYDYPYKITAPVKKDQEVGVVKVFDGDKIIFEEKLFTIDSVDSIILKNKFKNILEKW